jgi:AcrR family transcriptional regulator
LTRAKTGKVRAAKPKAAYHHGDLRRALVEESLALLEREGLEALSTRVVARRLGVSHAAPARHFPSRTALLEAVATTGFELFIETLTRESEGHRGPAVFEAQGRAYIHFALSHPNLLRLMFSPALKAHPTPGSPLSEAGERAHELLLSGARAALGPKASAAEVESAAFTGWALVHGAALLWLDGPLSAGGKDAMTEAQFLAISDQAIARTTAQLKGAG